MGTEAEGKPSAPRKTRISISALAEVEKGLHDYTREVLSAGLGEFTTNLYVDKADYFVRWLKYDFTPGERLGPGREKPGGEKPYGRDTSTA
jgi:hypothetical protein